MPTYTALYANGTKERVSTGTILGQGGEGQVYTIVGKRDLVGKIYHPKHQTRDRYEKLKIMISNPPEDKMKAVYGHVSIAWPIALLMSGQQFVGYLMPRIQQSPKILNAFNPAQRKQNYPHFTWRHLHHVGMNLAAAMHALHVRGYVVGDVNPNNILVTKQALVALVDTDSFQVRDQRTGRVYRCGVGTDVYTPPELQGVSFQTVDRVKYHDYFGLAVLIFQLLMEGLHPFTGVPRNSKSVTMPLQQYNIQHGVFPYVSNQQSAPPKTALPFTALVPEVRQLFIQTFVDGHYDPRKRSLALEWYTVLTQAEGKLVQCSKGHWYAEHLQRCPWCEREKQLQRIPRQRQRSQPQPSPTWYPQQRPLQAQPVQPYGNASPSFFSLQFSFSGRVDRRTWWLRGFLPAGVASLVLLLVLVFMAEIVNSVSDLPDVFLLPLVLLLLSVVLLNGIVSWSYMAITVKRLHDRKKSGWLLLALFIPGLGAVFGVWLWIECGFLPGR